MRLRATAVLLPALLGSQASALDASELVQLPSRAASRQQVDRTIYAEQSPVGASEGASRSAAEVAKAHTPPSEIGDLSDALAYVPTLRGKITLAQWLEAPALPQWWGAKCDGVADDTVALQAWLNALGPNLRAATRPGTCRFTQPLKFPVVRKLSLVGAGSHATTFLYDGASTTADIITIGDTASNAQVGEWNLSGFRVASNVKMTAGSGLRMHRLVRSVIRDLIADGQDGNGMLYNGLWFDQVDQTVLSQFEARGAGDALRLNGTAGPGPKAGLFVQQGKITGSRVGIRVGGGFGGFYLDQTDVIDNGTNIIVDHTLANEGNREIFIGSTVSFDSALDASSGSIVVDDSLAGNAMLVFTGTWANAGRGHGLWVRKWADSDLIWTGGTIGAFADNVRADDASARVTIGGGAAIRAAREWGVNPNVAGHSVAVGGARFVGNKKGNINPANPSAAYLDSTFVRASNVLSGTFRLDAAAYWQLQGGNPLFQYDANDYSVFDRSSNNILTHIGGSYISRIGSDGMQVKKNLFVDQSTYLNGAVEVAGSANFKGPIQANGISGITTRKAAGSCMFTITSGLITGVTGC
ncbi:hypothetical protein ABID82_005789 [Methylobacterium sp. PvP062]|uniref:Pectate lyase superfamily protein domain-containing protein n=1 Tax=Methylobacterium radiotolerans TaxID=31998 RepID=A0ABV2N9I0_9HYPH|nr:MULTISPECIES: hypothetical protein [unclassified Methylobacterium]MBP2493626.1 hypothetical protein [Methylobacterium sp. PvP105]MBP2500001.1 hypothetical protein [Methylobacterium sp. PvP109]MCX7330354.1 hypothetical protein [Hyphomicrobiales bacterium]